MTCDRLTHGLTLANNYTDELVYYYNYIIIIITTLSFTMQNQDLLPEGNSEVTSDNTYCT